MKDNRLKGNYRLIDIIGYFYKRVIISQIKIFDRLIRNSHLKCLISSKFPLFEIYIVSNGRI